MHSDFLYLGELIAFATTLSWSLGIFPFTEAARRLGPIPLNHFRLLLAVLFLTILSVIFLPISFMQLFSSPLPEQWLWFGLSGIIGLTLGDYFGFTSFAILGPRIGSVFVTLSPTATLLLGYFLIDERINFIGIMGILVTISGVIWLTLSRSTQVQTHGHEFGNIKKGILFGVLSAFCNGFGVVLANKGFTYQQNGVGLPFFQATWMRMVIATVIIYTVSIIRGRLKIISQPVLQNKNNGLIYLLGGTIFGPVIGVSLSMLSISLLNNKPSVAQTIFSLVPVFVLPLTYAFYKEKITLKAILGAMIAIAGVVILIWRNEIINLL
ncbi:MAG: DMT family transporter [Bacteroidota bacterium]